MCSLHRLKIKADSALTLIAHCGMFFCAEKKERNEKSMCGEIKKKSFKTFLSLTPKMNRSDSHQRLDQQILNLVRNSDESGVVRNKKRPAAIKFKSVE